jgi:hypothetical protein
LGAAEAEIAKRRVRVIALDLPTSWTLAKEGDVFTARMLDALNGMMLDMLAAVVRQDRGDQSKGLQDGPAA